MAAILKMEISWQICNGFTEYDQNLDNDVH